MLKKHNGFFLSDVVGLGKTMVATLIARQFLFLGGRAYNPTILLITPPALKQNWEDTLTKFEIRGKVKIFTNGSLHKITSPKDYDMVIIDEAHKFRNDTAQAYDELLSLISSYSCPVFALALLLSSFRISLYSFLMRVKKLPSGKSSVELLPS
jgi:SNF2 family DNA or RNA helicase